MRRIEMIKLIASDIDGTLVKDGEHQLNPDVQQPADANGPVLRQYLNRLKRKYFIYRIMELMWVVMEEIYF